MLFILNNSGNIVWVRICIVINNSIVENCKIVFCFNDKV